MLIARGKNSKIKFCILIFIILCGFCFYNFYAISNTMQKLPYMVMFPLLLFYTYKQLLLKESDIYFNGIRLLLILWFLSIINADIFWNQPVIYTYRVTVTALFFIIFFFFCKERISIDNLERTIVIFGWLYIILWLYAMFRAPQLTFGVSDDAEVSDNMDRGMIRINFIGRISMILAYFYYLNKCFIDKKPKFKIFTIIFFVFIILQVTRQLILWTGVVTIIYIFLKAKKLAIVLTVLFVILYTGIQNITFSDDNVIGAMLNLTNEQAKFGGDDIRVQEYRYFFNDWSPNIITSLFGNGWPHSATSYGHYYTSLQNQGLYISDVGYPCMYVLLGFIGMCLYIFLFIKGAFQKLPKEFSYVNMFFLFLIPANIAASWFLGADAELAYCICFYIIYIQRKNRRMTKNKNNYEIQHYNSRI